VSRELNDLVTPFLYRTVHFHSPGHIQGDDRLLQQLDIFGHPHFAPLIYTKKVLVTGSWYETYNEIESELGSKCLLSPAVRMFSNIIASCIMRMPNLREFTWVQTALSDRFEGNTDFTSQLGLANRYDTDSCHVCHLAPRVEIFTASARDRLYT
jgi:hypothetical protein